jgi:glyceraldehyde-3-phosphate dehydrogenase (NADP+)
VTVRDGSPSGRRDEGVGPGHDVISPVTEEILDTVRLSTPDEILEHIANQAETSKPLSRREVLDFLGRLKEELSCNRDRLVEATILETGFIASDSREIMDGIIEFLRDFEIYVQEHVTPPRSVRHSYGNGSQREMRIVQRPFRCVAAMVPQNASLTLTITVMASALFAGSRVVIRPSLQCSTSANLLAALVERSRPPESSVLILNCLADDFVQACCEAEGVDVLHYIGSNRHALSVFVQAFQAKKTCLMDGQGNGMLYVDGTMPVEQAVSLITSGATRYNGETCTSVNGVLIEKQAYPEIRDALVASFRQLRVGRPTVGGVQIGPLFSQDQAKRLFHELSTGQGQRVLCGGHTAAAYFTPAVVEGVTPESALVRQGFFGPAIWIHPIEEHEVFDWLRANEFPLSDTILSARPELARSFAANSRAARVTLNEDPSVESMFEPWGGYPPSGMNPVSMWIEKYRQAFQLDGRIRDILSVTGT